MAQPRCVNRLARDHAAYIAGLVDGEGTVTLTRTHRNQRRRLVVCVSNNELPILWFLRATIGVGKITGKRVYNPRHAPSYTFQVTSRQALDLLRQIVDYMRSYKARRARLALAEYLAVTPRNGRYRNDQTAAKAEFETRFFAIRT